MRTLLRLLALTLGLLASRPALGQSGTYFLDATNPSNGFDLFLTSGTWVIGVTGGGWSPWNYVQGCDAQGANCHTGFHTIFYYTINGGTLTPWGVDGGQFETPGHSDFYQTPELALAHVIAPLQLTITDPTTVRATIPDCCYGDNTGGLTLTVARVTVTPEPGVGALVAAGLGAMVGWRIRRRRRGVEQR
jgi:hypothetical protein